MADNKNGEHVDNSKVPQTENPPENIISTNYPETTSLTQETENMEVHHHPDLHHKPKKWKEYFLEFLMIFLAVTMGFFAENIREYFVEKKITREYLESYKQELEHNKKVFRLSDSLYSSIIPLQDSLVNLFFKKKENDNLQTTSTLLIKVNSVILPSIDVSAYQQLIYSGGLRYIHSVALKDSMSLYAGRIKYFENFNSTVSSSITTLQSQISSLDDLHDMINFTHIPEIMPYPRLTERERRTVVSYYRSSYLQALGNRFLLKNLNAINESLLAMIKNELGN